MELSLNSESIDSSFDKLSIANNKLSSLYPGDSGERQPVHTVYGGAQLFKYNSTEKISKLALKNFHSFSPNFIVLAKALNLPGANDLPEDQDGLTKLKEKLSGDLEEVKQTNENLWLVYTVYEKILKKLQDEALEDFRIDFEDGFGNRPDDEEDMEAERTALEVCKGMKEKTLPPFIGIRIKTLSEELKSRSIRTLDIFLTTMLKNSGGKIPENFIITLPKVTIPEHVSTLVDILEIIEAKNGLEKGTFQIEIMIETTQAILNQDGNGNLLALVKAANGRCRGAHFGTYDYTASCDITAKYQTMDHPVCDFAKHMMKVSLAGTGVWISDGATNVMPVPPNKATEDNPLTKSQIEENNRVVHGAWKLAFDHSMHSLEYGFYQGWDLHPAQLPIRYAACYTFFLQGLNEASVRLKNFIEKAAQATLVGDVFDDAATGQGLLNYFLRALNCGAISEEDVTMTGLTIEEVRGKSFLKILQSRKKV